MSTQEFNKILIGSWKSEVENIYIDFKFSGMASLGYETMPYKLIESGNNIQIDLPLISSTWTVDSMSKDRIIILSQEPDKIASKTIELIRVS